LKRILIIGNSAAGTATAESIRAFDKEAKITIVSDEPFLAYQRHKVLDYLEGKLKERELYFRSQDFYKNNSIELFMEREVVELNLNKKKVIFKDREFLEFDILVIASGSRVSLPALKGIQKEGVVGLNGMKEAKFLVENLPIAHTVVVVGTCSIALRLARIIASKKIEIKLLGLVDQDQQIDGVEIVRDNPITEILGDSEAKAVRLTTNKVIGASIVIYSSPKAPRMDFLKDTDIKTDSGILVDNEMRTNIPFVYAVGDCAQSVDGIESGGWEVALKKGAELGGIICRI